MPYSFHRARTVSSTQGVLVKSSVVVLGCDQILRFLGHWAMMSFVQEPMVGKGFQNQEILDPSLIRLCDLGQPISAL